MSFIPVLFDNSSAAGIPVLPDLIALQSEAQAGTDNTKWMTPLRTAQAISARAISEAPMDGQTYGRVNSAWHVINPVNVTLPTITGLAVEYNTLSDGATDTWTGSPTTFLWQWQRGSGSSWSDISGATSSSYTLTSADIGYQIRMLKSAINFIGQSQPYPEASPTSAVTLLTLPSAVTLPTITGFAAEYSTLSDGATDTWTGTPTSYLWQWQRGSGSSWSNISGATSSSYTLTSADIGYQIRMLKSAINFIGPSQPYSEASPTAAVTLLTLLPDLLAYWKLDDDGAGSVSLSDSSGNGYDLINTNGVSLGAGILNGGAVFNATNALSNFNIGTQLGASHFTLAAWIQPDGRNDYFPIIFGTRYWNQTDSNSFGLAYTTSGIHLFNDTFTLQGGQDTYPIAGTWYHVVFIHSEGVSSIYLNGALILSGADTRNYTLATLFIGACSSFDGGQNFSGTIDEAGAWNRALRDTEIAALYNAGAGLPFSSFGGTA